MNRFGTELAVHIASMRRYACALLRNRADADDLVQDALARALSRAERFEPGTNLRAWLFTILHNVHVNQLRQRAARPVEVVTDDLENRLVQQASQETQVELAEMLRALEGLPEEQRRVLLLVALEGLKYDEVAEVLGIPIGTVMSRLSRAREAVRNRLAGGGSAPPLRRIK